MPGYAGQRLEALAVRVSRQRMLEDRKGSVMFYQRKPGRNVKFRRSSENSVVSTTVSTVLVAMVYFRCTHCKYHFKHVWTTDKWLLVTGVHIAYRS